MANKKEKELQRKQKRVEIGNKKVAINYRTEKEFLEKYSKLIEKQNHLESMPIDEVAEHWLWEHREQVETYTEQCYVAPVKDISAWFKGRPIDSVTPMEIQSRLNAMHTQGYARQTISLRKIALNQIYDYAILHGFVKTNPMSAVKIPKGAKRTQRKLPEDLTLSKIISNVNLDFGIYALLAATTGARRGEICALTKSDFDFENDLININKVCILSNNSNYIIRDGTKSESGIRMVPILPAVKAWLQEAVESCPCEYIINVDGKPLVKWQYDKRMRNYQKLSGITCTSHQLRHLYATLCFDAGLDVKETQALLGHSKSSTTQDIYIHLRNKRRLEANAKLRSKINQQFLSETKIS